MQTVEFNERLTNILKTLQLEGILGQLQLILFLPNPVNVLDVNNGSIRQNFPKLIFQTNANLQALSADAQNKEIISTLGLSQVFAPEALGLMITAVNSCGDTHAIRQNTAYYRLFCDLSSALNNLKRFQQTVEKFLIQPNIAVVSEGETALEF